MPRGAHPGRAQGYVVSPSDDGDAEARCSPRSARTRGLGVPIIVEARVWGELYATRLAGQPRFAAADLEFAAAVATQVAAGVVQADHFARIERLAFQDPLTGLANRRAVDDRLEAEMATRHGRHAPSRSCSPTSTGSSRSTTPSATRPATG